jgi:hypothetical protein
MEALNPDEINPNKFYLLKDVATFLQLSYATVLKLKKQGHLFDTMKSGNKIYVSGKNILAYLNGSNKKDKKKE